MRTARTVFVDRDGVINVNRPEYVTSWSAFEFLPGSLPALALLADRGFEVVVVTNQSVVNRGLLSRARLAEIHAQMCATIAHHGGRVRAVLYCPHRPDEGCACRKPRPGLLRQAQQRLGVDPSTAVLVGDHPADLEAARRAGCRSILVLSGRTSGWTDDEPPAGCIGVVPDLLAAAERIVTEAEATRAWAIPWPAPDGSARVPGRDEVLGVVRA
jgi:D-glycero-D-manno-heptose 1,7-bisphosphate phosphatase